MTEPKRVETYRTCLNVVSSFFYKRITFRNELNGDHTFRLFFYMCFDTERVGQAKCDLETNHSNLVTPE